MPENRAAGRGDLSPQHTLSDTSLKSAAPGSNRRRSDSGARTIRGMKRRVAIVRAASALFARDGFAAVGMDDIGAAAGVTGPAIYRHFESKAAVLAAVIDAIIDAVSDVDAPDVQAADIEARGASASASAAALRIRIDQYAHAVAQRRSLMTVFVREIHHLPEPYAAILRDRQRDLVSQWRALLAAAHPDWHPERVRTNVHAVFGMLNSVGTFASPVSDDELAADLSRIAVTALQLI